MAMADPKKTGRFLRFYLLKTTR